MATQRSPGICTTIIDETGAVITRSSSCSNAVAPEPIPPIPPTPIPPDPSAWILETGRWDDDGVWIDTATWIDIPVAVTVK